MFCILLSKKGVPLENAKALIKEENIVNKIIKSGYGTIDNHFYHMDIYYKLKAHNIVKMKKSVLYEYLFSKWKELE